MQASSRGRELKKVVRCGSTQRLLFPFRVPFLDKTFSAKFARQGSILESARYGDRFVFLKVECKTQLVIDP